MITQLLRFALLELQSCVFAIGVFVGLVVVYAVPLPVSRYDAMLVWCVAITVALWVLGIETWREVLVICGFHLLGLGLELYKVRVGSWSYPGDAVTKVGGVPLFAGFMYAAVGSYICQAWRRFDLHVTNYPSRTIAVVAVAVYANFFTHHLLPDVRVALALIGLWVLRRSFVFFTVGDARYRMPLALSFLLIGSFLWLAENIGTLLGAWRYPEQLEAWHPVHTSKIGSWSMLVVMSFVLVASMKHVERAAGSAARPSRHPAEDGTPTQGSARSRR